MMESVTRLRDWLSIKWLDGELRAELEDLLAAYGREGDGGPAAGEIEDRFYRDLEFGTAGMRGILGAGLNRMNTPNVMRATQGFAAHLNDAVRAAGETRPAKAAIAYDNRRNSELFAFEAACVFVANGIETYLFGRLSATPLLSYTVRELGCDGGVVVTASHNAKEYNGYKIYGNTGCQCLPDEAGKIAALIEGVDFSSGIKTVADTYTGSIAERRAAAAAAEPLLHIIPDDFEERFVDAVLEATPECGSIDMADLNVVYTPLHGAGNIPVRSALAKLGVGKVTVVPEQELPDPEFTTCPEPNPENAKALKLGLALCEKLAAEGEAPDILIATDPDSDRVAIAVHDGGDYRRINGNELGILLLDFVTRRNKEAGVFRDDEIVITTIVSSPLVSVMAADSGAETRLVLTGFKNIGKVMDELARAGEEGRYLFGFEESCGYLSGTHVRDKDAINASALICAAAALSKSEGVTLIGRLDEIGKKFGYYHDEVAEFIMPGEKGMEDMARIMEAARTPAVRDAFKGALAEYVDFREVPGLEGNVVEFKFADGSRAMMRPSGTEPKLKIYISARAASKEAAAAEFAGIRDRVVAAVGLA
ncbi:MAG: phospho-sugar mutase [Clostridiales Family XIII bacterium]|jgi:phosphoglucomutase|nr:phospho-sugar mutase [Clostridiales Family XIII bacterium]